jgi:hypothetical protein
MQIVKKSQTNKIAAATSTIILEYLMQEKGISGAISSIKLPKIQRVLTVFESKCSRHTFMV